MPEPTFEELLAAMRAGAAVLQRCDVPFVLGGGLSAWARGGPKSEHDVDFFIREQDVDLVVGAFDAAGHRTESPPEGWLRKAFVDGVLIDLIFRTACGPVDDETIARSEPFEVDAVRLQIAPIETVMIEKLLAISEQNPDYGAVLELARSLREQIDWDVVRAAVSRSPFGTAFFTLATELGIIA